MKRKYNIINILIIFLAIVAIFFAGYFYYKLNRIENNKEIVMTKEVKSLVSKVSKLYLIPEGEQPTVATVSDPKELKDQSFFNEALQGDKVLIFPIAGKAVLYRPSINKIIEITTISNQEAVQTTSKTNN